MNTYFTFGSASYYPYSREDYILVRGTDLQDCLACFREHYPDRMEGVLNCADYYSQKQWDGFDDGMIGQRPISEYFVGKAPAAVFETDGFCKGFNPVRAYVPALNCLIEISEGDGSNLLSEDIEAGIVDYIYYAVYKSTADAGLDEVDGGMITKKALLRETYEALSETIPEVLAMHGADGADYRILTEETWEMIESLFQAVEYPLLAKGKTQDPAKETREDEIVCPSCGEIVCDLECANQKARYEARVKSIMAEFDCDRETAESFYEEMCGVCDPASTAW